MKVMSVVPATGMSISTHLLQSNTRSPLTKRIISFVINLGWTHNEGMIDAIALIMLIKYTFFLLKVVLLKVVKLIIVTGPLAFMTNGDL